MLEIIPTYEVTYTTRDDDNDHTLRVSYNNLNSFISILIFNNLQTLSVKLDNISQKISNEDKTTT